MVKSIPENADRHFKCSNCGMMFTVPGEEGYCPLCSHHCTVEGCKVVDTSDQGY